MGTLTSCLSKAGKAIDPDDARDIRARVRNLIADEKMDLKAASLEAIQTQIDIANDDLKMIYEAAGLPWEVETPAVLKSTPRPAQPKAQEKAKQTAAPAVANVAAREPEGFTGATPLLGSEKPKTKDVLEQRSRLSVAAEGAKKFVNGLTSQIANVDRDLYETLKFAKAERSLAMTEVAQAINRLSAAVDVDSRTPPGLKKPISKRQAGKSLTATARLKEIEGLLDKANNGNTLDEIEGAREALRTKYPNTYAEWSASRLAIDKMTLELMKEIVNKPDGMTNRDVALVRTMKKNLGTYLTRQYAVNQNEEVRNAHIDAVMNDWDSIKNLSPDERKKLPEDKRIFELAKNYLRDHFVDFGTFDEVTNDTITNAKEYLDALSMSRLEKLYALWVPEKKRATLAADSTVAQKEAFIEQVINDLKSVRASMDEKTFNQELENKALTATEDILRGFKTGKLNDVISYYTSLSGESGILQQRKQVPKPLRALMGEITQPMLQLHQTQYLMSRELVRTKMLNELYEGKEGVMWVDQTARSSNPKLAKEFPVQLNSDRFGPLNGKYVRSDIAETFDVLEQLNNSFDAFTKAMSSGQSPMMAAMAANGVVKGLSSASRLWKIAQIVMSPANAVADFLSTPQSILAEGRIPYANTKNAKRAFGAAYYLINAADRDTMSEDAKTAFRNYMTDSGWVGDIQEQDIQRLEKVFLSAFTNKEEAQGFLRDMSKKMLEGAGDAWSRTQYVKRLITDTKAMSDVVGKIYNFFEEVDYQRELDVARKKDNPNYKPRSERQLEKDAAATIDDTMIGYHRAMPVAKTAEGLTLTTLMLYFSEVGRTGVNKFRVAGATADAADAAKGPAEKRLLTKRAAQRTAGAIFNLIANEATVRFSLYVAPLALYALAEASDDDEWMEELKRSEELKRAAIDALPPEQRSKAWIAPVEINGKVFLFDGSRFGVSEPIAQPVMDIAAGVLGGNKKLRDRGLAAAKGLFFPNPIATAVFDTIQGRKAGMQKSDPETFKQLENTFGTEAANAIARAYDVVVPAPLRQFKQAVTDGTPLSETDTVRKAMASLGFRFRMIDPSYDLPNSAFEYQNTTKESRKDLMEAIRLDNESKQKFEEMYLDAATKKIETSKVILKNIDLARKLGYDEKSILGMLTKDGFAGRNSAGLNQQEAGLYLQGVAPQIVLQPKDLKTQLEKEIASAQGDRAKTEAIREKYRRYSVMLGELNKPLMEDIRENITRR